MRKLKVNDFQYGKTEAFNERVVESITLQADEIVEELRYHKAEWWWISTFCSFTILTNRGSYYFKWSEDWKAQNPTGRWGYCGTKQYSVKVPSYTDLNSFFESSLIYGTYEKYGTNWMIGFKNEQLIKGLSFVKLQLMKELKYFTQKVVKHIMCIT